VRYRPIPEVVWDHAPHSDGSSDSDSPALFTAGATTEALDAAPNPAPVGHDLRFSRVLGPTHCHRPNPHLNPRVNHDIRPLSSRYNAA
jgi:hypothetical protein